LLQQANQAKDWVDSKAPVEYKLYLKIVNPDSCSRIPLRVRERFTIIRIGRQNRRVGEDLVAGPMEIEMPDAGMAPLHIAARDGRLEVIKLLLVGGANVNEHNYLERAPLHLAAAQGHEDLVEELIEHGAEIDGIDVFGMTPLHLAVFMGCREVVELLLRLGAKVNLRSVTEMTPLALALLRNDAGITALLRSHGGQY